MYVFHSLARMAGLMEHRLTVEARSSTFAKEACHICTGASLRAPCDHVAAVGAHGESAAGEWMTVPRYSVEATTDCGP